MAHFCTSKKDWAIIKTDKNNKFPPKSSFDLFLFSILDQTFLVLLKKITYSISHNVEK